MDNTRIQYPWFKPYDKRSLLALPLWSERNTGERYITVEPRDQDRWRVTTIQLNNQGISQVTKQQTSVASQDEAATLIQMALGENAPRVQRQAEWRLKPASPAQKKTWRNLQPRESQAHEALTAGEASDTIAQQRFLRRIDPKIL